MNTQTDIAPHTKIAFIGAGNMTQAIIKGMVANGYPAQHIMATNPSSAKLEHLKSQCDIAVSLDNNDALAFADTIVLAVKPQMLAQVCAQLDETKQHKHYISIAAGVTVARIQAMLDAPVHVVRTMPNTPSSVGMGMTGIYAAADCPAALLATATACLGQVGQTLQVANEADINTVIAAAGSSPAYLFLFAQCMQEKAMASGFTEEDSRLLVAQALAGSAQMLIANPKTPFSELRAQVTSKGGTTAKAIESFTDAGLADIVGNAMQAAIDRAEEMQTLV